MPDAADPCPCGRGAAFGGCCGPLLAGEPAVDPESLMRSRFTAFAIGDAAYLRESWHPGTRPSELEIDPDLRWTRLRILDAPEPTATRGIVEFRAEYRDGAGPGALHERSRFVRQSGRWWYLDGVLDPSGPGTPARS